MCPSPGELIVSIRHLVYVTLYRWRFGVQVWMRLIQTCTPNCHLYRVTYTSSRIDTINSPVDRHMAARNMWRIEINIHEKELCVKLVIYKDYTDMHGQQNIKNSRVLHMHICSLIFVSYMRVTRRKIILFFCCQVDVHSVNKTNDI